MLHIERWSCSQLEILYTGHPCVSKRKQSRGLTDMCMRYKMIHADVHVRCCLSLESVPASGQKRFGQSRKAPSSGWASRWSSIPQSDPQRASGWVSPSCETEEVLSGASKITQRGMVKRRRSYGSIWQSVFASMSLSLTHRNFDGLVSLFNGISTFVGYLIPKPFSLKNSS